jgi:hypothetical protein
VSTWSVPIDELVARSKERIDQIVRVATMQLFYQVVMRSPVDTGRFRANWNFSINRPDTSTTESTDKSRGVAEAQKALNYGAGQVVYLTNALPYAYRLEHGWSKQAPAGMVKVSATEFTRWVQQAAKQGTVIR